MKILHLISSLGLFGAERVLLNLAGDRIVTAHVGAIQNQHNPHLEIIEQAEKELLPMACFPCSGRFDLALIGRVKRYCAENKIDILHTHNYKSNLVGLLSARLAGIKIVATAHGYTEMNQKVSFYEQLDRFILRFFDKVVVVADQVLPNFPTGKKVVIPNGIDISRFQGTGPPPPQFLADGEVSPRHGGADDRGLVTRSEFGFSARDFVVGTVGRLSIEKNQIALIRAAAALVPGTPNLKFLIVGEGTELESLKIEVGRWKIEKNVIFSGLRTDMPRVYAAMDVFVLPSLTEGVPLTILEAMAAKVPVVATAVGGVPQIIEDGKTGLLCPAGNPDILAQKIEALLASPALRRQLSEQGFEKVKQDYSLERMREEYGKVYREVNELTR